MTTALLIEKRKLALSLIHAGKYIDGAFYLYESWINGDGEAGLYFYGHKTLPFKIPITQEIRLLDQSPKPKKQFKLGLLCILGLDVPKPHLNPAKIFEKLAKLEYPPALTFLSWMCNAKLVDGVISDENRGPLAVQLLKRAIELGEKSAALELAWMYANDRAGLDLDRLERKQIAHNMYYDLAIKYNARAMYLLAEMYRTDSEGLVLYYIQAARWYYRATEYGCLSSYNKLALMYESGLLGNELTEEERLLKAKDCYQKASIGEPDATFNLSLMHQKYPGILKEEKTFQYLAIEEKQEINSYQELIHSLQENERSETLADLDDSSVIKRAQFLLQEYSEDKIVIAKGAESRMLLLAALRNLRDQQTSVNQLASLHIIDSAIHTLYLEPYSFFIYNFVNDKTDKTDLGRYTTINLIGRDDFKPTRITRCTYDVCVKSTGDFEISDLPERMRKPLVQRFFNFTEPEWEIFCAEMSTMVKSEQQFYVLIAPHRGCWSSIVSEIQDLIKCMHVLDWWVKINNQPVVEKIMVIPTFSMFQAAINTKAQTLGRTPVKLVPSYGYVEAEHYANLKAAGKIAFTLYLPEKKARIRYTASSKFRTTIDGHVHESAFAGAIHDVYHAFREMAMLENIAKARMRLAYIAKNHEKNKISAQHTSIVDLLIDGELIYSYPPEIDTVFDLERRANSAQIFGVIFHIPAIRFNLHEDLKRALIKDMVVYKENWQKEFCIGKSDLLPQEQVIYEEIEQRQAMKLKAQVGGISAAINRLGVLGSSSSNAKKQAAAPTLSLA